MSQRFYRHRQAIREMFRMALPAIAMIVAIQAFFIIVQPACADNYVGGQPLTTVSTGFVSGGLYVDASPANFGPQDVSKTFHLPAAAVAAPGRIVWARLYVSVYCGHMQNNYATKATVSLDRDGDGTYETTLGTLPLSMDQGFNFIVNGGNPAPDGGLPWDVIDDHTTRVSSDYVMWYNVTGLLSGQSPGVHVVTTGSFDGRVKVITLVVAYNDPSSGNTIEYWVNQGQDEDSYYMDNPMYAPLTYNDYVGSTSFSGIPSVFASATLTVNQMASSDGLYTFANASLPRYSTANGNSYVQGAYSGYDVWNVTGLLTGGRANLTYDRSAEAGGTGEFSGQFYKIPLAALAVQLVSPPAAGFTADVTSGLAPLTVNFTDSSSNDPTAWAWDFDGDGIIDSTARNPTYTYDTPGTYAVNLTVTNAGGSNSTVKSDFVTVITPPAPVANFTASPVSGYVPLTVQFTDLSSNRPIHWAWDFDGDGITDSTAQNPSHRYDAPGNYTVTLTVSNAGGSNVTARSGTVRAVLPPVPIAAFEANVSRGTVPFAVHFHDLTTNFPTSWAWDFGDGNTSGEQNPVHVYSTPGNYTVSLTSTNAGGSNSTAAAGCIAALPPAPVAGFTANATIGMAPFAVQFSDRSTDAATWAWDFDGDGIVDSTEQSPIHIYNTTGAYTVNLTVTNAGGSDRMIRIGYVTVTDRPVFLVLPSAAAVAAGNDTTVDILATSLPRGLKGYAFNLSLAAAGGASIVSVACPSWAAISELSQAGDQLRVSAIDQAGGVGPGEANVTLATVVLHCSGPGSVVVGVANGTLEDDDNDSFSTMGINGSITAYVPLEAGISISTASGHAPLAVSFTGTANGSPGPDSWSWDFGDGNVSSLRNVTHTYATPGSYTATLTIANDFGNDTASKAIVVTAVPPVAGFVASATSGWVPATMQFTDQSTGATAWAWDFDNDGIVDSTEQNPIHTYSSAGNYTVSLTVTGPGGSDVLCRPGYINVSAVQPCDLAFYSLQISPAVQTVFAREPNGVRIFVVNNGPGASPQSTVELQSSDGFVGRATVPALASGGKTTVVMSDTTIRQQAGGIVTFTATLDPDVLLTETNRSNDVATTAAFTTVYNGYKGKRYWTGGSDDGTVLTYDLHGGLVYSFGNSIYTSGSFGASGWNSYGANWTAADLSIPAGATVVEARLYVPYTWDNSNVAPDHVHVSFDGQAVSYQHWYHDESNFGAYAGYMYGLLTYDVTSAFRKNAPNFAVFTRDGSSTSKISMYGFTLAVVYQDANSTRKQIFMNEEFDLLGADPNGYATNSTEATAFLPFTGLSINTANVSSAKLITFVPSGAAQEPGLPGEGNLTFNDQFVGTNIWDYGSTLGPQVAVDSREVKSMLKAGSNVATIQSTPGATPCMAAAQAFLVVEYPSSGAVANNTSAATSAGQDNSGLTGGPEQAGTTTSPGGQDTGTGGPGSPAGQSTGASSGVSSTTVPIVLSAVVLFTGASATVIFFVLGGTKAGGAIAVGRSAVPVRLLVPALLIVAVLAAVAGGIVVGQSSAHPGPAASASPVPAQAVAAGPPNASFEAIPVIQGIQDTDNTNEAPDYPAGFRADNGILFGETSGDQISLDDIQVQLSCNGSDITIDATDVMPAINCTSAGADGYIVRKGGGDTIGPGDWFTVYADNCFDSTGASDGRAGKALSWGPAGATAPFVVYAGDDCDYSIVDRATGSVIQQGTVQFSA